MVEQNSHCVRTVLYEVHMYNTDKKNINMLNTPFLNCVLAYEYFNFNFILSYILKTYAYASHFTFSESENVPTKFSYTTQFIYV